MEETQESVIRKLFGLSKKWRKRVYSTMHSPLIYVLQRGGIAGSLSK